MAGFRLTPSTARRWAAAATLLLMVVAVAIVMRIARETTLDRIVASLGAIGPKALALALAWTAASHLALTGFDWLGVAYAGGRLPYRRVALASFVSMSIGHTVGLAPFSSGAIRYRYYAEWGLDARQVGLIVLSSAVTVALGEAALTGLTLVTEPGLAGRIIAIGSNSATALGCACIGIPVLYLVAAATVRRAFSIGRWRVALPDWRIAAGQVAMGLVNFLCVAAALQSLLGAVAPIGFQATAVAFMVGNLGALVSHVPGGIGVMEAVILIVLPGIDAVGPLIAFRIVYFLIPLALGGLVFGVTEIKQRRHSGADFRP